MELNGNLWSSMKFHQISSRVSSLKIHERIFCRDQWKDQWKASLKIEKQTHLHASILKPDLHLAFAQVQALRQFPALLLGDVVVIKELLLQFQRLQFGVGLAFLSVDGVMARRRAGQAEVRDGQVRQVRYAQRAAVERMVDGLAEVADER